MKLSEVKKKKILRLLKYGGEPEFLLDGIVQILSIKQSDYSKTLELCQDKFVEYFKMEYGRIPAFNKRDYTAIGEIASKVRQVLESNQIEDTPEIVADGFGKLLSLITDFWLKKHLTLPNINAQFNAILSNNPKSNNSLSYEQLIKQKQSGDSGI